MHATRPDSPPVEVVGTSLIATSRKYVNADVRLVNGKEVEFPPDFAPKRPLYRPHGKWAWTRGSEILSCDTGTRLGSGLEGTVNLKVGFIEEKEVMYISKLSSVWDSWNMFTSSLYLNATTKYLRPLQGDCVPWIIGVYHCDGGRVGVAQDLPHPTGWREADMFLEEHQKEAIIAAYQKLHNRGILHGDVEFRHMLLGDDGKVTIIDFGFARVLSPDEQDRQANVDPCSRGSIRDEMRKVKFILDWKDSRSTEYRLAKLRNAREEKDREARLAEAKECPFPLSNYPREPMSEEEEAAPGGALSLRDLNEWSSSSKTWRAQRYQVIRRVNCAQVKKSDVPRPHIPENVKTEEATPPAITTAASEAGEKPSESAPTADDTARVLAAPRKRSREQAVSDPVHNGSPAGTGMVREGYDEPVQKRRRNSDASTLTSNPTLKRESSEPLPAGRRYDSTAKTSNLASAPASVSRVSPSSRTPASPKPNDVILPNPTPNELDLAARAALCREALRGWSRFSLANARVEQLQHQLEEEKLTVERHRSDFLRTFLMLSAEERTTIWNDLGQPDVRHLLGLLPESRASSNPAHVLESARTQLSQSRPPRGLRDIPRPKTHPRLTAIKRSEGRSRPPSKLSQAVDISALSSLDCAESSSRSSSADEQDSGPSPELKAKLEQLERYKEVVFKRARLEEDRERAVMPPPRTTRSSCNAGPPRRENIPSKGPVNVNSKRIASPSSSAPSGSRNPEAWDVRPPLMVHPLHQKLARMMWLDELSEPRPDIAAGDIQAEDVKSSVPEVTALRSSADMPSPSMAAPEPAGEHTKTTTKVSGSVGSTAKRKREETEEDGSLSPTDVDEREAKKIRSDSCGLM